jgi:hypothetical protein
MKIQSVLCGLVMLSSLASTALARGWSPAIASGYMAAAEPPHQPPIGTRFIRKLTTWKDGHNGVVRGQTFDDVVEQFVVHRGAKVADPVKRLYSWGHLTAQGNVVDATGQLRVLDGKTGAVRRTMKYTVPKRPRG